MRRAVGGHLLRGTNGVWTTTCGEVLFFADCMTGVEDMKYTTSVFTLPAGDKIDQEEQ